MRGTVSGSLWGLVIGGVCLGVASQVGELPEREATLIAEAAPESAAEPDVIDTASADISQPETEMSEVPEVAPLQQDDGAVDLPLAETEPPAVPETVAAAPEVSAPAEPAPPAIAPAADDPVAPASPAERQPELVVEAVPEIDQQPAAAPDEIASIDVDTETVVAPTVDGGPVEPDAPIAVDETLPTLVAPTEEIVVAPAPVEAPPVVDAVPDATNDTPPIIAEVVEPDVSDRPVAEEQAEAVPTEEDVAQDIARVNPDPQPAPEIVPESEPDAAPTADGTAAVEEPAAEPSLPGGGTAVRVNRPGAEPTAQAGQEAEIVPETEIPEDAPALLRYATAFENPQALPMLSLMMVDDPSITAAPDSVAALGFPVTVILDPLAADAVSRMAAYRAAGIEVGISASLPGGATPSDVEIAFEAALAAVPDAVVLFSDGQDGVQGNRSVTEQVVEVLAADGRGLVTIQRGLGNALRIAEQANVPAAAVLRDLDGDGQSPSAIGRALDQAAFRARQSGDAVLLAKVSDATLGALAAWGGEVDSDQFLMAPVTAILKDQITTE